MDNSPVPPKKGIGALGWLGIGCGGVVLLVILGLVIGGTVFGPQLKKFAEDAAKDPARVTATTTVNLGMGKIEMVKEDPENKRYTLRDKGSGKLTTIYFNAKKKVVEMVEGDFSAIPADANAPAEPAAK